ncbi:hypothetical protein GCM10023350_53040 [Nocardioides endophyticus]|uniref:Uncharacterized protein n=1 Tax=Nocardioides endophyticus TaxID=1353775 RepID=A0ABP8ZM84_9ACTN
MRHTWTKRKAPELVPGLVAEDARLVGRLRSKAAELSTDLAEAEGVRASLDHIRAREVKVPRPTPLFEVQKILAALENALQRAVSADQVPAVDTFGGIPLNLDDIDLRTD